MVSAWWANLPAERKIDLLGVLLFFIGCLSLFSLSSGYKGGAGSWWVAALRLMGGEGAVILPLILIVIGAWLVIRKIERVPVLSWQKILGLVLVYLNVLGWLHLLRGGGWARAERCGIPGEICEGGGYFGAFFERFLSEALGTAGAGIIFFVWLALALMLTLNISFTQIMGALRRNLNQFLAWWDQNQARWQADRQQKALERNYQPRTSPRPEGRSVPDDFIPLPGGAASPASRRSGQARPVANSNEVQPGATRARTGGKRESVIPHTQAPSGPNWVLPPVAEILDPPTFDAVKTNVDQERARLIEDTLGSFGAPAHVVDISRGPTVTQFGVEPDFIETRSGRTRVRVAKIVALADDLALALAAQRIRIQAPVPGRSFVGIEVPNSEVSRVMLRETMESEAFRKIRSTLRFAIGKDVSGRSVAYDLANMPHLLIAGTTGAGKSVCVNAILTCLLLNNTPNDLRLVLVDPKRVELTGYNGIPHLLTPVIVEAEKVVGALQWVQREMDARYHRFSQTGVRNIEEYNNANQPKLPYLVVLVDELADLMMLAPEETERSLTRLAQLARATGIHLVLATQRPSVDVVTGLIKANFRSRIAFAVASQIDSRVILDQPGAERLLGKGDMLFQAPDAPAPVRLQGVWVSDPEIKRLIDYWRTQDYTLRRNKDIEPVQAPTAEPVNMELPPSTPLQQGALFDGELGAPEGDPIFDEAVNIVRSEGRASISLLQRKMRIGYTRAARIIDAMEDKGIVGPAQSSSQVRAILDWEEEEEADEE